MNAVLVAWQFHFVLALQCHDFRDRAFHMLLIGQKFEALAAFVLARVTTLSFPVARLQTFHRVVFFSLLGVMTISFTGVSTRHANAATLLAPALRHFLKVLWPANFSHVIVILTLELEDFSQIFALDQYF